MEKVGNVAKGNRTIRQIDDRNRKAEHHESHFKTEANSGLRNGVRFCSTNRSRRVDIKQHEHHLVIYII